VIRDVLAKRVQMLHFFVTGTSSQLLPLFFSEMERLICLAAMSLGIIKPLVIIIKRHKNILSANHFILRNWERGCPDPKDPPGSTPDKTVEKIVLCVMC